MMGYEGPDDGDDYVFSGTLQNAHILSYLLKGICTNQIVKVTGTTEGLKFSVEESRIVQIVQYVPEGLFQPFSIKRDEKLGGGERVGDEELFAFNVHAKALLQVMTTASKAGPWQLQVRYPGYGSPLQFILVDSAAFYDLRVKTMASGESALVPYGGDGDEDEVEVMLRADGFREVTHEMDKSVDKVDSVLIEIAVDRDKNSVLFSFSGIFDEHKFRMDNNTKFVERFRCDPPERRSRYNYALFKQCFNALSVAHRFQLRMDSQGVLFLQFNVKLDDNITGVGQKDVFIDFYLMPALEDL